MNLKKRHISREFEHITFDFSLINKLIPPFLGKLTLLSMLPAFLYGCDIAAETAGPPAIQACPAPISEICLSTDISEIEKMDVFVFRDDWMQKLDCYQRFDNMKEWDGTVVSGSGPRIITILANSPYERNDWLSLNSRSYLKNVTVRLEDETRGCAATAGEIYADTEENGLSGRKDLFLQPFASEVALNSISCDFTGRPYSGERLSGARVYLTNVNAESGILDEAGKAPRRIINAGRLCLEDMENFKEPDLLMQEIGEDIGRNPISPDIRLWCYQSAHPEESPGTPYTRLVIEGRISGRTYYWPIDINRDTDQEPGIWRNRRYAYDVKITRKGSTSPDVPVKPEDISINQEVTEWKEIKEYEVTF